MTSGRGFKNTSFVLWPSSRGLPSGVLIQGTRPCISLLQVSKSNENPTETSFGKGFQCDSFAVTSTRVFWNITHWEHPFSPSQILGKTKTKVMSYSPPSLTFSKALTGRGSASQILLSNEFVVFTMEKLIICLAHKFGLQGPLCFPPCEVSFLSLLKASLQPWHFIVCRFALLNTGHFVHLLSWSVEWYLKDTIRRHVLLILAWTGTSLHSCKLLCNCMSTENCNEQSKGQVFSAQPQHKINCLAEPFHSSTWTRNPSEMGSILTGCCCTRQSRNIIICSRTTQQFLAGTPWPARQELQNPNPVRT